MGGLTERRRLILAEQPHLATAYGSFVTDVKAPAAITGAGSAKVRICGKNLFDPSVSLANPSNTTMSNATKRIFTPFTYCIGGGWSNYFNANQVTYFSVSGDTVSIVSKAGYSAAFAFPLVPGETYILSVQSQQYGETRVCFYQSDGTAIIYGDIEMLNRAFTVPSNAVMTVITLAEKTTLYGAYTAVFQGLQLEQGSVATSYEPYSGQDVTGPTSMTTRRGRNSILTAATGISIKYWTHQ